MSLSHHQCRQVVEKVWKWRFNGDEDSPFWYDPEDSVVPWDIIYIEDEINSWEGFGRTVEGMRNNPNKYQFSRELQRYIHDYIYKCYDEELLFDSIHLAAIK